MATDEIAGIRSVCVYCGARVGRDPGYEASARALGAGLAERGIRLIYGGGRIGMMGVVADAAVEAGGYVVGIIPRHLEEAEVGHRAVAELLVVESMHERKALMAEMADAFVVLPGGLGTLDETLEILTWRQLGLHDKPILVLDVGGYWRPLHDLIDHVVAHEFARPSDRDLVTFVDGLDSLFSIVETAPRPPQAVSRSKL